MATKRSYGDACRFAYALDLVGERWALLVVRELLLGPKRFTDLRTGLPHASPNVLSERLRGLEEAGVVRRRRLPPPAGSWVYELTDWGSQLEPVVTQLGAWGARASEPPADTKLGTDSAVLALKSLFDPEAAAGVSARYELRLGEDRFHVDLVDGDIELHRGSLDEADARFDTDPETLLDLIAGERQLTEAQRSGEVRIEGDRRAAQRFLQLFAVPEPAAR
jgi:DNA-binding HxlR family transcriptional regulator/putative sterol carrier protein